MDNLVGAFRAAGHRAELVRLPTAWDKDRLFDSALAWRMVPLDCDLVVAINFPAYFVRHPHKVVWLFHQHRGAYDAADAAWSDFGHDDVSLETQRLLSEWDARAIGEAERRFAISQVAADRLARYNGLDAEPLYHPPPLHDRLHEGPFGDDIFCPSRGEQNKRPQLVLEALGLCRQPVRAALTGTGTLEADLRRRAAALGGRAEVLGFIDDDELIRRFATALAVAYPPLDEDYGYVTLQAFLAGKPIVTTADSGGVLEWVEDGVNGFVTDGSPEAMARAFDTLYEDRQLAERMGAAGRARASALGWGPVVERLLGG